MARARPHFLILVVLLVGASAPVRAQLAPLEARLCAGRSPCRVLEVRDAGRDAGGRALRVAKVALFDVGHPRADGSAALYPEPCAPFEWHSIIGTGAGARTQLLTRICNDGYGAAGVGFDDVRVDPNRVSVFETGGSAWRWSESNQVSISPPRLLRTSSEGYWNIGPNAMVVTVDYEHFTAAGGWGAPVCGEEPSDGVAIADPTYRWASVPRVTLAPSATRRLERGEIDLGRCALSMSGQRGWRTLSGERHSALDAVRALWVRGGPLLIDVVDDQVTPDDTVELYVARDARPSYAEHCVGPPSAPRSHRIRLRDGRLLPQGTGGRLPPVRRIVRLDGSLRFIVQLPASSALTIVRDDVDGEQRWRAASSTLNENDDRSVGDVWSVRGEDQGSAGPACSVTGDTLVPSVEVPIETVSTSRSEE